MEKKKEKVQSNSPSKLNRAASRCCLFLALAAAAVVIAIGFLINTIVFFESQQVKVLWIGGSIAIGLGIFRLITYLRQSSDKNNKGEQS